MAGIEECDLSDLENLLDDQSKQTYEKCLQAAKNGLIKWHRLASVIYTKDELKEKFNQLCESLENRFNIISDKLNAALIEKLTNLLTEIIKTCDDLKITLPEVKFDDGSYASLVYSLEKKQEMLKVLQKNTTLVPSTAQLKLKSPTTHKRISQSYEEFKATLSERKSQRSTGLFWLEHGIPKIALNDEIDSAEFSLEESTFQ